MNNPNYQELLAQLEEDTIVSSPSLGVNYIESAEILDQGLLEIAREKMTARFRGFYPVVLDVETGGFDAAQNPILQVAIKLLSYNYNGDLEPYSSLNLHIMPLASDVCDPSSLKLIQVDPYSTSRKAVKLKTALEQINKYVLRGQKIHGCSRSIVVAHNASFDHGFIVNSYKKIHSNKEPFHPFVTFDTSTVGALMFGQTRLKEICLQLGLDFDQDLAHDAMYDTIKACDIFCQAVNEINSSKLNPVNKYNL